MGLLDFRITKNYIRLFFEHLQNGEDEKALRLFYDREEVKGYPLSLHYACYFKCLKVTEQILKKRKNLINYLDELNQNPLHYAVNHFHFDGHTLDSIFNKKLLPRQILRGIERNNLYDMQHRKEKDTNLIKKSYLKPLFKIIDLLVDAGVDLEQASNDYGPGSQGGFPCTPLFVSIAARDEHTSKYLIEKHSAKVDLVEIVDGVYKNFVKKNYTIMSIFHQAYDGGYSDISENMQKKIKDDFEKYLLDKNAPNENVYDLNAYAYD